MRSDVVHQASAKRQADPLSVDPRWLQEVPQVIKDLAVDVVDCDTSSAKDEAALVVLTNTDPVARDRSARDGRRWGGPHNRAPKRSLRHMNTEGPKQP